MVAYRLLSRPDAFGDIVFLAWVPPGWNGSADKLLTEGSLSTSTARVSSVDSEGGLGVNRTSRSFDFPSAPKAPSRGNGDVSVKMGLGSMLPIGAVPLRCCHGDPWY